MGSLVSQFCRLRANADLRSGKFSIAKGGGGFALRPIEKAVTAISIKDWRYPFAEWTLIQAKMAKQPRKFRHPEKHTSPIQSVSRFSNFFLMARAIHIVASPL